MIIASHSPFPLSKDTPRHPLVLAADGFKSVILASCVPSTNPAFFRAQAALCLAAHSAQLFSASEVRVSVALYVILPHSHTHSHRRTFLSARHKPIRAADYRQLSDMLSGQITKLFTAAACCMAACQIRSEYNSFISAVTAAKPVCGVFPALGRFFRSLQHKKLAKPLAA